jgi:hypothetical protein
MTSSPISPLSEDEGEQLRVRDEEDQYEGIIGATRDVVDGSEGEEEGTTREEQGERDETSSPANDIKVPIPCSQGCTVCGALPFCRSAGRLSEAVLWDDAAAWDWDGGLYDLVRQRNGHETYAQLPPDVAKSTVEATSKHLRQLKEQLMKAGLLKQFDQNYSGESVSSARIVAPFDLSELVVGEPLGAGYVPCSMRSIYVVLCVRCLFASLRGCAVWMYCFRRKRERYLTTRFECRKEK